MGHMLRSFPAVLAVCLTAGLLPAQAEIGAGTIALDPFECDLLLQADGVNPDFETAFEVPHTGTDPHAGETKNFEIGPYKLSAMADSRWMGLQWWRGKELLAYTVVLATDPTPDRRVVLLFNPKAPADKITFTCTRKISAPPELPFNGL